MGDTFKGGLCPPFLLALLPIRGTVTLTRRVKVTVPLILLLLLGTGGVASETTTFEFDRWAGPALEVRLYVPDDAAPDTPIVIVIHGWSREAGRYFDDWRALGEKHGFVVVVPHFTVADFPGSKEFS